MKDRKEVQLHDKTFEIFITEDEILKAVEKLVSEVEEKIGDDNPLFIGVLNGSFLVVADFVRRYKYNCEVSFVKMASYEGTGSTGKVKTLLGVNEDLKGRNIVIIEDIVDTGNTLEELLKLFGDKELKSLSVATLFYKPEAYKKDFPIEHIGMEIENKFIVGYGLDYDGWGRNLPHIYKLKE
ncbi:MAG: hypoxanthine phosphoribosyltransferase [Ichthyobacteriaceae bacterium]|nr:hypoxanthine phosphoribosyltransferase [Ichthyobacteriaceae bacterium]